MMMAAQDKIQYDKVPPPSENSAYQYVHTAHQSTYHNKIVVPNFLHLIGDVKDKQVCNSSFFSFFISILAFLFKVLDLACGDGLYTRILKAMGARKSLGVDICPSM